MVPRQKEGFEMEISIRVFEHLYYIAQTHGVTQTKWSDASGIPQPTISYFVKTSRMRMGLTPPFENKWRFTLGVARKLYEGLERIIGVSSMLGEAKKRADAEPDKGVALYLLALSMIDGNHADSIGRVYDALSEEVENVLKGE